VTARSDRRSPDPPRNGNIAAAVFPTMHTRFACDSGTPPVAGAHKQSGLHRPMQPRFYAQLPTDQLARIKRVA